MRYLVDSMLSDRVRPEHVGQRRERIRRKGSDGAKWGKVRLNEGLGDGYP